jgi:DNA-directed RNA polymerase specialized sigma24 family protein
VSAAFAATRWTLVAQARGGDDAGRSALSELCAAYYEPVVTYLRCDGRTDDAARELAHGFFERLLAGGGLRGADPARGKFRSYLLGAVKHFLQDEARRHFAEKRGGGAQTIPLEDTASGLGAPYAAAPDAERAYDRQWALTIIARALDAVAAELTALGKAEQFEILKPWINGDAATSQAEAAARLGMSEGAVKVAIHRLRQRFREEVKAEIAETIPAGDDADAELRHLIAVLSA